METLDTYNKSYLQIIMLAGQIPPAIFITRQ